MYNDFVSRINIRVEAILNEIETIYNFDVGDEFEIGICKLLKTLLPEKYGVCRGHIITKHGTQAGDDIIIYDKHRFPILRMLNEDSLWRKQFVPVEAVYAYIEAKNTIHVEGDMSDGQSLMKAVNQVHLAKSLVRSEKSIGDIDRYVKLSSVTQGAIGWPKIRNPMYGCILARNIKLNRNSSTQLNDVMPLHIHCKLKTDSSSIDYQPELNFPDLIIGGKNHIIVPSIGGELVSPFLVKGESSMNHIPNIHGKAFGIGLSTIIYALNAIDLDDMYWPEIIANASRVRLTNATE
ncbi:hypothetical protein ABC295_003658 [Vibrio cholerae]|uniref:DUF6602 domain-containing protein n=1 Tax=Vibrio cholerae TaxID=666 RepID=UPI00226E29C7|nr:DUF6602 domain-containing protein [Vibrio cholerae]MCX9560678.1 hypothetical protein [Vibrio cholerae]MCX9563825.1 hypothetical protein [Vibrio cholerae]